MNDVSFSNLAVVACGTLSLELNYLRKTGFLDARRIFFTTPGLHEDPMELERQLLDRIQRAKEYTESVIVVYGGKFCYVNAREPLRTMDKIIVEQGPNVARIQATYCVDAIAGEAEREKMSHGEKVWWMTPGWIKFRDYVFKGWDKGLANENFPRHTGGAMIIDGIGFWGRYLEEQPEELLEYSDWMGIPIQSYSVTLDRLKMLLMDQARILTG